MLTPSHLFRLACLVFGTLYLTGFLVAEPSCAAKSEIHPDEAQDVRASPPDLEGTFWLVQRDQGESVGREIPIFLSFWVVEITQLPDRNYRLQLQDPTGAEGFSEEDEPITFRVLRTADPNLFLALENSKNDGNIGINAKLLARSQAGTWVAYEWHGILDTPIYGARGPYLNGIARHYGVHVTTKNGWWKLESDGTVDDAALSALFSDPDFLGGLRFGTEGSGRLFPANVTSVPTSQERPKESENDEFEHGNLDVITVLHSPKFSISPDELTAPAGFAGQYLKGGINVQIARKKDGSYQLKYPTVGWTVDESLKLLSLDQFGEAVTDATGETYLGLSEYIDELHEGRIYKWNLVNISCRGDVSITSISHTGADDTNPTFSEKIERLVRRLRAQAAERHGLTIFDNHVAGDLNANNVRALFADPQFQVGLEDYRSDETYRGLDSINRCESGSD